jgi:hypothetical protein
VSSGSLLEGIPPASHNIQSGERFIWFQRGLFLKAEETCIFQTKPHMLTAGVPSTLFSSDDVSVLEGIHPATAGFQGVSTLCLLHEPYSAELKKHMYHSKENHPG